MVGVVPLGVNSDCVLEVVYDYQIIFDGIPIMVSRENRILIKLR